MARAYSDKNRVILVGGDRETDGADYMETLIMTEVGWDYEGATYIGDVE